MDMAQTLQDGLLRGFGLANYRSFDSEGFIIIDMKKVNIFMGKNNSGKSNVLRAIRLLRQINAPTAQIKPWNPFVDGHDQKDDSLILTAVFSAEVFLHKLPDQLKAIYRKTLGDAVEIRLNLRQGKIDGKHPFAMLDMNSLKQGFQSLTGYHFPSAWPMEREPYYQRIDAILIAECLRRLREFDKLLVVPVFRELREGKDPSTNGEIIFDGHNTIARLYEMQIPSLGKEPDRIVFHKLQSFVRELLGEPKLTLEIPRDQQILIGLEEKRLPLDSFGTGIHHLVILCSALAMYEGYVVTIEEPEVHFHPDLQRKLLRFIVEQTNNRYYISTHSNVFLDALPDVNLYHVQHDGARTSVAHVAAPGKAREVLTDMGYKASDLLQANGVIWVEGPSDRIYINKWLKLLCPELVEGIHYAITFYGGKVLAHFSAADDAVEDFVQVLRINRHAMMVIDRDGDAETALLNKNKQRIITELGKDACWVTQGREIENYLPASLIENYLGIRFGKAIALKRWTMNSRLDNVIAKSTEDEAGARIRYSLEKVRYAREFCDLMTVANTTVLDLKQWLTSTIVHIRMWNRTETKS